MQHAMAVNEVELLRRERRRKNGGLHEMHPRVVAELLGGTKYRGTQINPERVRPEGGGSLVRQNTQAAADLTEALAAQIPGRQPTLATEGLQPLGGGSGPERRAVVVVLPFGREGGTYEFLAPRRL